MVMPRSRSMSIRSRYCARALRSSSTPVSCSIRSASVDLPWSMCAMMQKLRMIEGSVRPGWGAVDVSGTGHSRGSVRGRRSSSHSTGGSRRAIVGSSGHGPHIETAINHDRRGRRGGDDMATTRTAKTHWEGSLFEGAGQVSLESSGLGTYDVSWPARAEEPNGMTSPEELIAAAHSACFSMAFSKALADAGHAPQGLDTSAVVTFH